MRNTNFTFWYCNDEPRMIHVADINMVSDRYKLGNVWEEPRIHARNAWHNFFSVYGDLEPNGASFEMRLSGHHTDINYRWDDNGKLVQDTPVFLGHNPFVVPPTTPPLTRQSNERADASDFHSLIWQSMAGIQQFAEAEQLILAASKVLETSASKSYLPLKEWRSTGYVGLIQPESLAADLVDGNDEASLELYSTWDLSTASQSNFDAIWALIEYTLKFSRGNQPTSTERDLFRREGKVIWTTSFPPDLDQDPTNEQFDTNYLPVSEEDLRNTLTFLNLRIETEEWLYSGLVNSMFTVVSEFEPSNHLHSVLLEKKWITGDHACVDLTDPKCNDDHGHNANHAHRYLF